jgi:hypothetical protein
MADNSALPKEEADEERVEREKEKRRAGGSVLGPDP